MACNEWYFSLNFALQNVAAPGSAQNTPRRLTNANLHVRSSMAGVRLDFCVRVRNCLRLFLLHLKSLVTHHLRGTTVPGALDARARTDDPPEGKGKTRPLRFVPFISLTAVFADAKTPTRVRAFARRPLALPRTQASSVVCRAHGSCLLRRRKTAESSIKRTLLQNRRQYIRYSKNPSAGADFDLTSDATRPWCMRDIPPKTKPLTLEPEEDR